MPIGPSHGARGGGFSRGSDGGGSRGRSRGGSGLGSLVGHLLGAAFLTAGVKRSLRRSRQASNGEYNQNDENSLPRRKAPTLFLVLAIITAVIAAFTMVFRNNAASHAEMYENQLSIMKSDWVEYKALIEKANEGGHQNEGIYTTTASFSSTKYTSYDENPKLKGIYLDFYKDGIPYYFIVYTYNHKGETYVGRTYTQFSASQAEGWNGKIAYHETDEGVYSINLNYNLETCVAYKHYPTIIAQYNDAAKNHLIAFIVELLVVALFVFLYVVKLKKHKKLVAQDEELLLKKQQAEVDKAEAEAEGLLKKAEAMKQYGEAAMADMQLEVSKAYIAKLPEIVAAAGQAYSNVDAIYMYGGDSSKLTGDIMTNITQISEGLSKSLGIDLSQVANSFLGAKMANKDNE